jgi:hypothetical protein
LHRLCEGLKEILRESVEWINLAQHRDKWWGVVNSETDLWVPKNAGNFLIRCEVINFSRKKLRC